MSNTARSRPGLASKSPRNVPKSNGVVYPISFSSMRDGMVNSAGYMGVLVKESDLSFETSRKRGGTGESSDGNSWVGSSVCWSSNEVRLRIGEAKKPGRSSATVSADVHPVRRRVPILGTCGSSILRKVWSSLISGTAMSTTRGTALARSRHRGTRPSHPIPIDFQFSGL